MLCDSSLYELLEKENLMLTNIRIVVTSRWNWGFTEKRHKETFGGDINV